MLPDSFCDMQTFHPEPNPSKYLHNINMFTIYVISVVGEQICAPWIKTPQKDRMSCQLSSKASDSKGCPPTKL